MGETTAISWTDHTFNPWWGCTKVSAGCDNCYAESFSHRLGYGHHTKDGRGYPEIWGKGAPRRTFGDKHWNEPLKWDRDAAAAGVKCKVFCASMADIMDDEAPEGQRERLWSLINRTPNLIWQLLTKRPHRFVRYLPADGFTHCNVWLGITAENQEMFDVRVDHLIDGSLYIGCPDFISYEPALGPLSIARSRPNYIPDWIILGGESGTRFRPMQRKWFYDLIEECRTRETDAPWHRTKIFVKQMAARTPAIGKGLIPAEMMIQEFPA